MNEKLTPVLTVVATMAMAVTPPLCGEEDAFERARIWNPDGVKIDNVSVGNKEGKTCLRFNIDPAKGREAVLKVAEVKDWTHISFWVKVSKPAADSGVAFRFMPRDYSVGFTTRVALNFKGWMKVELSKADFRYKVYKVGTQPDWEKVHFLYLIFGCSQATEVFLDGISFLKSAPARQEDEKETLIHNCDSIAGWRVNGGVKLETSAAVKMEGKKCLLVRFGQKSRQAISVKVPSLELSSRDGLAFWLRGPGITTQSKLKLKLGCSGGASFEKDLDIRNFEWGQQLFFADDFQKIGVPNGAAPRWDKVDQITFALQAPTSPQVETFQLDAIRFRRMRPVVPLDKQPRDKRFWWWKEDVDRFAAMHVREAEWPRLMGEEKGHLVAFSERVLGPGVPYTVYFNDPDLAYSRFSVTIRDWDWNVVGEFECRGESQLDLIAPDHCGTYVLNIKCYDKENKRARTYQTGVSVLAKLLSEPEGIWGLHTFVGTKGSNSPNYPFVFQLFRALGVGIIRERVVFPVKERSDRVHEVCTLAHRNKIRVIGLLHCYSKTSFKRQPGFKPGVMINEEAAEEEARDLAREFRGFVDIWEVYNEPNRGDFDNYAKTLRVTYRGLKKGNPDVPVSMAGMGVWNKWQNRLIEMEKRENVPYSDMLGTHLYPEPETLKTMLQGMIHGLDRVLPEKGMLMTEGGMPELDSQTMARVKHNLLPGDYSAERATQYWYARYAPVILGECMKVKSKLHGVNFFRSTPSMGDWFINSGDPRVHSTGFFTNRWNTRIITFARPIAYTFNTIARLLTHEVKPAEFFVSYDKTQGAVEAYFFRRPGEYIGCLWTGLHYGGMKTKAIDCDVELPEEFEGMVLACDMDGNETVVTQTAGFASVHLVKNQVLFLRMIEMENYERVYFQNQHLMQEMHWRKDFCLVARPFSKAFEQVLYEKVKKSGLPSGSKPVQDKVAIHLVMPSRNPAVMRELARDRNLPVISSRTPQKGMGLILYSPRLRKVFVVGNDQKGLVRATERLLASF